VSRARRDFIRAIEAHGPLSTTVAELGVTVFRLHLTKLSGRIAYLLTTAGVDFESHSASEEEYDSSISVTDLDMGLD
jgi:hypothetical protein